MPRCANASATDLAAAPRCLFLQVESRVLERLLCFLGPGELTLLEEACGRATVEADGGRLSDALEVAWEATARYFFIFR